MEQLLTNEVFNIVFAAVGAALGWWFRGGKSLGGDDGLFNSPAAKLLIDLLKKRLEVKERQQAETDLAELVKDLEGTSK